MRTAYLCELPIGEMASVSATAICGPCDNGTPRIPEWQNQKPTARQEDYSRRSVGNKTQDFLFNTRAETDQKMYELHQQGIIGWPHVIERVAKERAR